MSFRGGGEVTPASGPMSFLGGYPSHWSLVLSDGYPSPGQGVPQSQQEGYPSPRQGVPEVHSLITGQGYPSSGVPLWPGQDWVSPRQERTGVPPPPGQDKTGVPQAMTRVPHSPRDWLCRGRYASCGFPQEDFLVLKSFCVIKIYALIV